MIDQLPPTLPGDRAVPTAVTHDRAIAGADQPDRAVAGTASQFLNAPREPLNRRGRRHLSALIRRSERQIQRSLHAQALADRAAR
jgi:hypothetical protein